MGPFGSGKSSACVMEIAQRGVQQVPGPDGVRRTRWAVIRNSYRQLEDTTQKTFFQWFSPHIHGEWKASAHEFVIKSLGAKLGEPAAEIEVLFRALDRPDQLGNLLSTEYTGGWINEGREVPWAIFDGLSGRVGRYPAMRDGGATWSGVFSDTNPPDTDSDWYKFFEERRGWDEAIEALAEVIPGMTADKFAAIFKQPSGRAPNAENLPNLPKGYYQRLAIGKAPEWCKIYIDGLYGFTSDGMAVFPEYNDAVHCPSDEKLQPRINPDLEVIRSWDFGLTPACSFSQVTETGRWIVVDELIGTNIVANGIGADRFGDAVLEHSNQYFRGCKFLDIGDPAGNQRGQGDEKTCFQILWAKGIDIRSAPQTLRLRLEGVRKPLNALVMGRPQFVLHPRCVTIRKGMLGGYHFRRMRVHGETYASEPNKNSYSHICDTVGYAGAWIFGPALVSGENREEEPTSGWRTPASDDRTRSSVTGY